MRFSHAPGPGVDATDSLVCGRYRVGCGGVMLKESTTEGALNTLPVPIQNALTGSNSRPKTSPRRATFTCRL